MDPQLVQWVALADGWGEYACDHCGSSSKKLQSCPCKEVSYCGKSCQTLHWSVHKQLCSFQLKKDQARKDQIREDREHIRAMLQNYLSSQREGGFEHQGYVEALVSMPFQGVADAGAN
jgi:hypothetical protein